MSRKKQVHAQNHFSKHVVGMLVFIVLFSLLCSMPALFLLERYTAAQGVAAPVAVKLKISIGCALLAYVLLRALFGVMHCVRSRRGWERPRNMFDDALDALDEIARGNYNVYVQAQDQYLYSDLAKKINRLARDLSSVEQMRQEFISNVSHEIQSPLTSISGFAALLKKPDLPPEQRLHYLQVIETESKRLSKLSENLLRLSVLDSGQSPIVRKEFRLDKQIKNSLLLLEPQWAEKEIEFELAMQKIWLAGDEGLLGQVWSNLLHNAVKFTPPKGRIAVSLAEEGGQVVCTISDSGAGIAPEDIARIFERFYKADKARDRSLGGNGLGLSIAYKIVDLHGGKITAKSGEGAGAAFVVTLPQKNEPPS